ncbi:hypothetical protein LY78DRAFT_212400 [Colletotrichum sublineola]|nr:hypothetical protein LY78DRAFT_212400 [Colletotrichum sublineola]
MSHIPRIAMSLNPPSTKKSGTGPRIEPHSADARPDRSRHTSPHYRLARLPLGPLCVSLCSVLGCKTRLNGINPTSRRNDSSSTMPEPETLVPGETSKQAPGRYSDARLTGPRCVS